MSERLSALIDNELDELERARILKELGGNDDLAERWSRYHIIGLAMRREKISSDSELSRRVVQQLDSERDPGNATAPAFGRASWFQPAGRLAIAASVAGVLLVGGLVVKLYEDSRSGGGNLPTGQQVAFDNDATRWQDVDPQVEDALNALLLEHGEFTSASGMNGLTAYTKFVAYDSQ